MKTIASFGIDQAFGKTAIVANISKNGYRQFKQKLIKSIPLESPFEKFYRSNHISNEIVSFILEVKKEFPDENIVWKIALEGLSMGSVGKMASANRDLAGLQFIMMDRILNIFNENDCAIIPPKQLKKFATDDGNADKDKMVEAIKKDYIEFYDLLMSMPKTTGRYDLADAFWLSEFMHKQNSM